jgi:serine/threonine protein kinase
MAPEIYNRENYTSKVDVWSIGVIAYQLMFK